jgi:hypothetical protein
MFVRLTINKLNMRIILRWIKDVVIVNDYNKQYEPLKRTEMKPKYVVYIKGKRKVVPVPFN